MLRRDRKRWRIKQIDELDDGELDEQKCTQKIGVLPGPTKKWRIKRIDELDDDELDEFYCIFIPCLAFRVHVAGDLNKTVLFVIGILSTLFARALFGLIN